MTPKQLLYLCLSFFTLFTHGSNALTTISWSSYFGGADYDNIRYIAKGPDGTVYVAGSTNSADHIATAGSFQPAYRGGSNFSGSDAFLARFSADGHLLWATYYGGENSDVASGLAVDTSGNVYLCGWTASDTGMATSGSYQSVRASAWAGPDRFDAFLVKFNASGSRLWSTYVGGSNDGFIGNPMGLSVSASGAVTLSISTESADMVVSAGAHQPAAGGGLDGYLISFDASGSRLFATYHGGEADDRVAAVCNDKDGNILLTGYTQSIAGISSAGSAQPAIAGAQDAYLAKFSANGSLIWSTYCGGGSVDRGAAVTCDSSGSVYLGGVTLSNAAIATAGSFQQGYAGGANGDGFIIRYRPTGEKVWGSYYGGTGSDQVNVLSWKGGVLWVAGATSSEDSMSTAGGPQQVFGGTMDGFVARLTDDGATRLWATYYGGVDGDLISGIVADDSGVVYLCGSTASGTGIATPDAHQAIFNGGEYDGFMAKLKDCQLPVPVIVQAGSRLATSMPYATYQWNRNGVPITGATDSVYVATTSGDYSVTVSAGDGCSAISGVIHVALTGIAGVEREGMLIYPNPVRNNLYLQSGRAGSYILSAVDGRIMQHGPMSAGKQVISMAALQSGLYILQLTDRNGRMISVKKIAR